MAAFDVLIAGAGPAGCAAALSIAAFAPELHVGLVDARGVGDPRIGETVPPQIAPVLAHLRLWDEFTAGNHCPSYRTLAAWGDCRLASNEFLFHAHQVGWRLDRAAFDRMLVAAAGACVGALFQSRVIGLSRQSRRGPAEPWEIPQWSIRLSDSSAHTARFVVDATGRAAALGRRCGLRPAGFDRLVGCLLQVESRSDGTEGLIVEAFTEGWWYSAVVPGGSRVVICMTDADRIRPLGLTTRDGFDRLLGETRHLRLVAVPGSGSGRPAIRPAGSQSLKSPIDLPLLCVGDAAHSHDPVSGDGIVRALRSGIFASYAIADWLRRGEARGLSRYHRMLREELAAYDAARRGYYALEQRWPDKPFWRRRHDRIVPPERDLGEGIGRQTSPH